MPERILLVDDELSVLNAYRRILRGRYSLDTAESAAAALDLVKRQGPYAVIISDMRMPNMDGANLLARLRQLEPDTVRIMLTGNADQQTAIDAVNQGEVYRFLTKPCDRSVLLQAIDDAIVVYQRNLATKQRLAQGEEDLHSLRERLEYEVQHDVLTGLANRHAFGNALGGMLAARDEARQSVLCHLDLDQLHIVNDTCGQVAGDAVLRALATMLSSLRGPADVVGRLSGDSFAVWFADTTVERAQGLIAQLQQSIRMLLHDWEGKTIDVRVSAGLVAVDRGTQEVTALLSTAETACNVAKEGGRGQLHIAGPDDEALTNRFNQSQWIARIGRALRDDRFQLFKQNIVRLNGLESGEHYEVLIRMLDDRGQLLSPAQFLGAAEQYRLTPDIDAWVIRNVVEWFDDNPGELDRLAMCSINLSGHSLGNATVLELILSLFAKSALPAEKVCFEITETATIARLPIAVNFINRLKAAGFRFALDDFGSGLSSFGYLKNLPVDYLKIDGSFVRELDKDPADFAFVRCIHEVAATLGMQTIAEFVENAEILSRLEEIGVDYAQGYHFHKPSALDGTGVVRTSRRPAHGG